MRKVYDVKGEEIHIGDYFWQVLNCLTQEHDMYVYKLLDWKNAAIDGEYQLRYVGKVNGNDITLSCTLSWTDILKLSEEETLQYVMEL
jgi:uncharacterized lipoprotein YehR (DUF1307 family)